MVIRAEPDNVKSFFTAAVLIRDPMRSLCDYVIRSAYFAAGSFFLESNRGNNGLFPNF